MAEEKWTQDLKKGTFTREAKARGLTCAQLQKKVLANPDRYSPATVARARARKTLVGPKMLGKRRK